MVNIFKKLEKPDESKSPDELYKSTKDTIKLCSIVSAMCSAFAVATTAMTVMAVSNTEDTEKKAVIGTVGGLCTIVEVTCATTAYKRLDEAVDVHDVIVVQNMIDSFLAGKFAGKFTKEGGGNKDVQ
jgi:hypothetical protein